MHNGSVTIRDRTPHVGQPFRGSSRHPQCSAPTHGTSHFGQGVTMQAASSPLRAPGAASRRQRRAHLAAPSPSSPRRRPARPDQGPGVPRRPHVGQTVERPTSSGTATGSPDRRPRRAPRRRPPTETHTVRRRHRRHPEPARRRPPRSRSPSRRRAEARRRRPSSCSAPATPARRCAPCRRGCARSAGSTATSATATGSRTKAAVRGFQAKRGFDATGTLDERTWDKLVSMTHRPTADELANVKPEAGRAQARDRSRGTSTSAA